MGPKSPLFAALSPPNTEFVLIGKKHLLITDDKAIRISGETRIWVYMVKKGQWANGILTEGQWTMVAPKRNPKTLLHEIRRLGQFAGC